MQFGRHHLCDLQLRVCSRSPASPSPQKCGRSPASWRSRASGTDSEAVGLQPGVGRGRGVSQNRPVGPGRTRAETSEGRKPNPVRIAQGPKADHTKATGRRGLTCARRLQGTSPRPACSAHQSDLSPCLSSVRTLSAHSHSSVLLAVLPCSSLFLPSALSPTPSDTLFPSFTPPPTLPLPVERYPTSSRLSPAPTGGPSASTP